MPNGEREAIIIPVAKDVYKRQMFDVEEQASEEIINMLRAIPGVFRVRVVK